jgi:hypothetical protein
LPCDDTSSVLFKGIFPFSQMLGRDANASMYFTPHFLFSSILIRNGKSKHLLLPDTLSFVEAYRFYEKHLFVAPGKEGLMTLIVDRNIMVVGKVDAATMLSHFDG